MQTITVSRHFIGLLIIFNYRTCSSCITLLSKYIYICKNDHSNLIATMNGENGSRILCSYYNTCAYNWWYTCSSRFVSFPIIKRKCCLGVYSQCSDHPYEERIYLDYGISEEFLVWESCMGPSYQRFFDQ